MAEAARPLPLRAEARVLALVDEGGPNRRLSLDVPDWPGFAPGQFVMLSPGARGAALRSDPLLPRPMAVYRERAASGHTAVEILFKVHGRGTALLADVRAGERVRLVGPLGTPFPDPPDARPALLVAGGTGIASVYELAARLTARGGAVTVLLGARSERDLMGEGDFAELGVGLRVATEDGSRGSRGLVTDLLGPALEAAPDACVYACGPTAMMRAAAALAAERACPCWVSLENPMACGFGVCLGCAAPRQDGSFALVCRDGPVLPAESVAWEGLA